MVTRVIEEMSPDSGGLQQTRAIGRIPVIAAGPHSSERLFTEWGAVERETFFDFPEGCTVAVVCGDYSACFDERHNLTKEHLCFSEQEDKECRYDNVYNEEGRLVRQSEKRRACWGEWVKNTDYSYDATGRLLRTTITTDDGYMMSDEQREYNPEGVLTKKTIHYRDETMRFTYRAGIQYFIAIRTSTGERKIHYRTSLLDEQGNITQDLMQEKTTLPLPTPIKESRLTERHYNYTYDPQDNWTRKDFFLDGEHYFVTREIEYYDGASIPAGYAAAIQSD